MSIINSIRDWIKTLFLIDALVQIFFYNKCHRLKIQLSNIFCERQWTGRVESKSFFRKKKKKKYSHVTRFYFCWKLIISKTAISYLLQTYKRINESCEIFILQIIFHFSSNTQLKMKRGLFSFSLPLSQSLRVILITHIVLITYKHINDFARKLKAFN